MIEVVFLDSGREPKEKPDPLFPKGRHIDMSGETLAIEAKCTHNLPYPAPRCGFYNVECKDCGLRVMISVAGRTDDPRTLTTACKRRLQ